VKKNDGFLFLSSIAKTPEAYFLNIVMGEHILGLLPVGTHEWDYLINQDTCEGFLNEVNFNTFARSGVTITNPLTNEMGEIPLLNTNYMMMAKNF
jgi:2-polyprenyl-6-hydroxyphenyl methylase/3-demethylubiquinone-9 3-methyltransferase